jgi:hypothetical protein
MNIMITLTGRNGFIARFEISDDGQIIASLDAHQQDSIYSNSALTNISTWHYLTGRCARREELQLITLMGINFESVKKQLHFNNH